MAKHSSRVELSADCWQKDVERQDRHRDEKAVVRRVPFGREVTAGRRVRVIVIVVIAIEKPIER